MVARQKAFVAGYWSGSMRVRPTELSRNQAGAGLPRQSDDRKKTIGKHAALLRQALNVVVASLVFLPMPPPVVAAESADELQRKLSNPVANLISVPLQNNFDFGAGVGNDGLGYTLNIQPVVPISISTDWNMISRTILPVSYRDYFPAPNGTTFGLGDITQSLFFSPKEPGPGGLIWGIGPAFVIPTATNKVFGYGKFGLGPTAVVLLQKGPWTLGALANQIWSVAGDSGRPSINQTFVQPFLTYGLGHGASVTLNTESAYDWDLAQWTVPINLGISQIFKIGDQMLNGQVGVRYYADKPSDGPDWGLRAAIIFLFPET